MAPPAGLPPRAPAAPPRAAALQAAVADVEAKKHKRDPFGERFVALATSSFGAAAEDQENAPQQHDTDTGRNAVAAAAATVHIRTELIRSMKNALVRQTAEAVKRAAPAARPRLGSRARQAAAAAGGARQGGEEEGEEGGAATAAAPFCDAALHVQLELLLQGRLRLDLEGVVQGLLRREGDPTRLPEGDLALELSGELAAPPFEELAQSLVGEEEAAAAEGEQPATATDGEVAALEAALVAVRQHTALLEGQGVLHAADEEEVAGWPQPTGWAADEPVSQPAAQPALPAYLLPGQQQQQGGGCGAAPAGFQSWPAWQAGAESDAIQEADEDGAGWNALEAAAAAAAQQAAGMRQRSVPRLGLQRSQHAAGAVAVSFDDDEQGDHGGDGAWRQRQPAAVPGGQARLSELWEGGGAAGAGDPWDELEEGRHLHQHQRHAQQHVRPHVQPHAQQQGQQAAANLRMPAFARRRQPAQLEADAERVEETDEEGEWDEGMLAEVAALEQQALEQQAQQAQQQQAQRRVPVFRSRVSTQQQAAGAWPAAAAGSTGTDAIEDASSDEEQPAAALTTAAGGQVVAGGLRRPGAVPQLGARRGALPLGAAAAAAEAAAAAGPSSCQPAGRRAFTAPAPPEAQLLCIDFAAINVEALRPSVLLGRLASGKQRWKPAYDPEALLLPRLRAGLPLPSTEQPQAAQQAPPLQRMLGAGGATAGNAAAAAAAAVAAELAGLTAEELAGWDDWGDEEEEGNGIAWQQQQQQQQSQWQAGGGQEAAVEVQWDEPEDDAPPAEHSPAPSHWQNFAGPAAWQPAAAQTPPALTVALPAQTVAHAGAAGGMQLQVSFDYDCGYESSGGAEAAVSCSEQRAQAAADGGGYSPSAAEQQQQQQQQQQDGSGTFAWEACEQAQPEAAAAGCWAGSWGCQSPAANEEAGTEAACVWEELDGGYEGQDGLQQDQEEEQQQAMAVMWETEEEAAACAALAADGAAGAGPERDPWAALEPDAAAGPGAGGSAPWASPSAAPAEPAAVGVAGLGWDCELRWEDEEAAAASGSGAALLLQQRSPGGGSTQPAGPLQPAAAFEWEFDDGAAELAAPAADGGASGAAQRLALGLGLPAAGSRAAAPAPAHKRRHAEIGAQIIRSLLEERRRSRVDLQPLLLQLSRQLAAALMGGGTVALSTLRQRCMAGGEAGTQASLQRYMLALLTAAHQHNSGAAGRAQQAEWGGEAGKDGTAAVAAAVAPLAAALGMQQLHLSAAPGGGSDVLICAAF